MTNKFVILAALSLAACTDASTSSQGGNNDFAIVNCAINAGVKGEISFSRPAGAANIMSYVWSDGTVVSPAQQAQIDTCVGSPRI